MRVCTLKKRAGRKLEAPLRFRCHQMRQCVANLDIRRTRTYMLHAIVAIKKRHGSNKLKLAGVRHNRFLVCQHLSLLVFHFDARRILIAEVHICPRTASLSLPDRCHGDGFLFVLFCCRQDGE